MTQLADMVAPQPGLGPEVLHAVHSEGSLTTVQVQRPLYRGPSYKVEYSTDPRFIRIEDEKVPSVTEVLNVLDKPALPWWGMKIGVEGTLQVLTFADETDWPTPDQIVDRLKEQKLTVNHQKDKAGDRGHAVHEALDVYAQTGELPFPDQYPEVARGYITSAAKWLAKEQPEVEAAEVVVGSLVWGYGGRFDLRCKFRDERVAIVDYKTSKRVYETHQLQVSAYELASVEMGWLPTDEQGVLLLHPDGKAATYKKSKAEPWHFTAVLQAHKAMTDFKGKKA